MRRIAATLLIAAGLVAVPSVASAKPDGYIGFGRWAKGYHATRTQAPSLPRTPMLPRTTLNR